MGLSKTQRSFLQAMMSLRVLSERRTAYLYRDVAKAAAEAAGKELSASAAATPDEETLDKRIGDINELLEKFNIQLRKGFSPCDGGTFWGVVNSVADESSKLASEYSPPQVALFQSIIQALLEVEDARLPLAEAQALGLALERNLTLKISEAAKAIQSFHKARWLRQIKPPPGGGGGGGVTVTFGVRAVLELPDVKAHVARHARVMGRAPRGDGGEALQRRRRSGGRRVVRQSDEESSEAEEEVEEQKGGADTDEEELDDEEE